jgi:hypothetical protein
MAVVNIMCVLLLLFRHQEGITPRRRITVTSSLNEMSTDQLGKGCGVEKCYFTHPHPLPQQASGQIFKRIEIEFKSFDKIGTSTGFCTYKMSL